jgi:hypothetical protein
MLIEQQEKRKRLFIEAINVQPGSITTASPGEEFIGKRLRTIEKNVDNPENTSRKSLRSPLHNTVMTS